MDNIKIIGQFIVLMLTFFVGWFLISFGIGLFDYVLKQIPLLEKIGSLLFGVHGSQVGISLFFQELLSVGLAGFLSMMLVKNVFSEPRLMVLFVSFALIAIVLTLVSTFVYIVPAIQKGMPFSFVDWAIQILTPIVAICGVGCSMLVSNKG